mmetsp:Transcript_35274/g.89259  ORF Transcript_35274/g.89259 Transcript_35274/m.89259 type:complete len:187 (-) Transcript_35274:344-904(-)
MGSVIAGDPQDLASLQAQLEELRTRLHDLHCTDVNSLRRAHKTLQQHVQALDIESRHLGNLVAQVDTPVITPEGLAKDIGAVAGIIATTWGIHRGLACIRLPPSKQMTRVMVIGAAALVGWRLLRSGAARLRQVLMRSKSAKAQLLEDWKAVADRIAIMVQLCEQQTAVTPALAAAGPPAGSGLCS